MQESELFSFTTVLTLLGGIALFLFALHQIEHAVKAAAGRTFKLFLQRHTRNVLTTVVGSALITGVLQGSSVIMMLVLAFLGAGVLPLRGALAVMLGANLGTTLDSWLVAGLGFRMELEMLAYPLLLLGVVCKFFLRSQAVRQAGDFLIGFGLFFISVYSMKSTIAAQMGPETLMMYADMQLWQFTLVGVVVTAILQSSLATMTLALGALESGGLRFDMAAAVVLGAEVGTTLKFFLGGAGGDPDKRRLALGNFIVNLISMMLGLLFIHLVIHFVRVVLQIEDSLFGLVAFQSFFNLASVLLFLPVLPYLSEFLKGRFVGNGQRVSYYLREDDLNESHVASEQLRREVLLFLYTIADFNLKQFGIEQRPPSWCADAAVRRELHAASRAEQYAFLKSWQGEIQLYYLRLRQQIQKVEDVHRLEHLMAAVRSAMLSAKSVKDIGSNMEELRQSSRQVKYATYVRVQEHSQELYAELAQLVQGASGKDADEALRKLLRVVDEFYTATLQTVYDDAARGELSNVEFTSVLNFNREVFTAHKAILRAAADFLLPPSAAEQFNELPVSTT